MLNKKSDKKYGKYEYVQNDEFREKARKIESDSSDEIKSNIAKVINKKDFSNIKKLVKKDEYLEFKIDESLGTDKFDSLLEKRQNNYKELVKAYKDIGYRIAGKYADKRVSGGTIVGKVTLQTLISSELWDMAFDELVKEGKL